MSNGNEHDPIDRLLNDAFRSRPQPDRGTASIADVRRRARRRQNTRVGGTLGVVALVGIGGVAVMASRSPGSVRTSAGDITSTTSDGNDATACQLTLQPTDTTIETIEGTWATDVAITAESDGYSTTTSTTTSTFPDNTSSYPATTIEVLAFLSKVAKARSFT